MPWLIPSVIATAAGTAILTACYAYVYFRKIRNELQASNDKFRQAFMTSPDFINLNRLEDGVYLEIKEGFTKIMGYSREEVIGKSSEELYGISIHDHLTRIYNRRYVFERLDAMVTEYQRETRHFSVSIIDLDYFKKTNDARGHQAGDFILKEFASILSECFRPYDLVGRYGGEEFMVLMMNVDILQT